MPRKATDLTGRRFDRIVVVARCHSKDKHARWLFVCECGNRKTGRGSHITAGAIKSCGCITFTHNLKHGNAKRSIKGRQTKIYSIWIAMKDRCINSRNHAWSYYGGRGITVCERWLDFSNFLKDMGPIPANCSIDRIDVNGNYSPDNCRWATPKQQQQNRRGKLAGTSKYKGVVKTKNTSIYRSRIMVNNKLIDLGCFKDEAEAACVYNQAAIKHFGKYAYLNEAP